MPEIKHLTSITKQPICQNLSANDENKTLFKNRHLTDYNPAAGRTVTIIQQGAAMFHYSGKTQKIKLGIFHYNGQPTSCTERLSHRQAVLGKMPNLHVNLLTLYIDGAADVDPLTGVGVIPGDGQIVEIAS